MQLSENEAAYPDIGMFGHVMPSYGIYLRHASRLNITNVTVSTIKPDLRSAMMCLDVDGLKLDSFTSSLVEGIAPVTYYKVEHLVVKKFANIGITQEMIIHPLLRSVCFLMAVLFLEVGRLGAAPVEITSLELNKIKQGYGNPQVDMAVDKHPLTINGRTFAHGLGTHADSYFAIKLDKGSVRFYGFGGC